MNQRKKTIGYHFGMLHRLNVSLAKEGLSKLDLTPAQVPFIATLLNSDVPMSQDELSTNLVIDKGATARTIDHLEKFGLVSREVNPDNRRQKLVSATSKCRKMYNELFEILDSASDVLLKGIPEDEKEKVVEILNKMISNGMEAKYGR